LGLDVVISAALVTGADEHFGFETDFKAVFEDYKILPGGLKPMYKNDKVVFIFIFIGDGGDHHFDSMDLFLHFESAHG
jgi:hypothetical protein